MAKGHIAGITGAVCALALAAAVASTSVFSVRTPLAVADNSSDSATSFGIDGSAGSTTSSIGVLSSEESSDTSSSLLAVSSTADTSVLTIGENYDVMVGVYQVEAEREAERLAEEEAARIDEQEHIDQATANYETWLATADSEAINALEEVDWSVGKEAFIAEWTARIDNYLSRTVLAGYGEVFATAAWEYGVDPRWSPAISNTESGNGFNCFLPHNAWGWGDSSWSSWTQAINEHVAGLASHYGYSITYAFASKYCPPNTDHWFSNTISQMERI